jgi:hypothetical protein
MGKQGLSIALFATEKSMEPTPAKCAATATQKSSAAAEG